MKNIPVNQNSIDDIEDEMEIVRSNIADAEEAGLPTDALNARLDYLEDKVIEIEGKVSARSEEEIMSSPRGSDKDELAIREELKQVQRKNRDAKVER